MLFVISLIVALLLAGRVAPEDVLAQSGPFHLTGWALPVDSLRSLSRIFIAFLASLLFTIGYGYAAAAARTLACSAGSNVAARLARTVIRRASLNHASATAVGGLVASSSTVR